LVVGRWSMVVLKIETFFSIISSASAAIGNSNSSNG